MLYVRLFGKEKINKSMLDGNPIFQSRYFPKIMQKTIRFLKKEDYILGPIYEDGDFQFGVTGSVTINEKYENGLARELGEEIGLVPKSLEFLKFMGSEKDRKNQIMNVYTLDINNTVPVLDHQEDIKVSLEKDDKIRKVGCFVHGTENEIIKFLSQKKIYVYSSDDKIVGIGAIKVRDVLVGMNKNR